MRHVDHVTVKVSVSESQCLMLLCATYSAASTVICSIASLSLRSSSSSGCALSWLPMPPYCVGLESCRRGSVSSIWHGYQHMITDSVPQRYKFTDVLRGMPVQAKAGSADSHQECDHLLLSPSASFTPPPTRMKPAKGFL